MNQEERHRLEALEVKGEWLRKRLTDSNRKEYVTQNWVRLVNQLNQSFLDTFPDMPVKEKLKFKPIIYNRKSTNS